MNQQQAPTLTVAEKTLQAQLIAAGTSEAANQFGKYGLPTRRVEAYHYTDLKNLVRDVPAIVSNGEVAHPTPKFSLTDAFEVPMINGDVPSVGDTPDGIIVAHMDGSGLSERDDVLVRLNRALSTKSVMVRLEGNVQPVVHFKRHINGEAAHVVSSLMLDVAAGTEVTVLETFEGSDEAHMANYSTRINLGAGAKFTHITIDQSSKKATHFHTMEYAIGADVELRNLVVNSGASLSRTQMFGRFEGEGTHANLSGLNLVDDGQHCDITMDMTHTVENTSAQELFKSVVRNRAKAIFQGRIVVESQAQKTDAKMMAQGLMLTEGAQILTKPELEIFADDVQCGHGCTCGELDADTLFYLMSRGIPKAEASSMLIRAFVQELLDPITDEELNSKLSTIVSDWLELGEANAS